MGNGATECGWRHAPEVHGGFWGFWKSQLVELSCCLGRRWLAFACSPKPGQCPCDRCHTKWGGRWKRQNRKNVYLSPYVEEPLNSKVIKSFIPELRSHKCFSCFEILMFYVYMLRTFDVWFHTYPYHGYGTDVVAIEKRAFWSPLTCQQLYFFTYCVYSFPKILTSLGNTFQRYLKHWAVNTPASWMEVGVPGTWWLTYSTSAKNELALAYPKIKMNNNWSI